MGTLGEQLRQAREAREESLRDVEEATCIRAQYLEALEIGDLSSFPGGHVQARGFLRVYARHLGLSPEQAVAQFQVQVGTLASSRQQAPAGDAAYSSFPPSSSSWLNREALIISGIIFVLLVGLGMGTWYLFFRQGPGQGQADLATQEAGPPQVGSPVVGVSSPLATPAFPISADGSVSLSLAATEHVWVRVTADGEVVLEGMLSPDQTETWTAQDMILVDTGNGAGLRVAVNGQDQGVLCGRGELCSRAWGPAGEIPMPPPSGGGS